MAKRSKPYLDNHQAVTLRLYVELAQKAKENRQRAERELAELERKYGIDDKRKEINNYRLDEHSAILRLKKLILREVPDFNYE